MHPNKIDKGMSFIHHNMNPFEKGEQSLFILQSPLQCMCAINAIHDFGIEEYRIIVYLLGEKRDQQVIDFLNSSNVDYEIIQAETSGYKNIFYRYNIFLEKNSQYKRAFIGDYRNVNLLCLGFKLLANKSTVVFLDDGAASISVLNGDTSYKSGLKKKLVHLFFRIIAILRQIDYGYSFYTIYNIPSPKFRVRINQLDYFSQKKVTYQRKGVFILGTNVSSFCPSAGVSEKVFFQQMANLFDNLRSQYEGEDILFVPHGRDETEYPKQLCKTYNIRYVKSTMPVENYLLAQPNAPGFIYGYTSSALYNLKLIFPESEIYNMVFRTGTASGLVGEYENIREFYERNGIKTLLF